MKVKVMTDFEPVIGLEVHAELMTRSKMFCGCRVVDSVEAQPNTAVCPVCLGMPGMLPVINKQAVELATRVGLALNCSIQHDNVFARKNYFYPDLPKAYQISQYELPLAINGWLDLEKNDERGQTIRVRIRRVHLEEDTGKLTHLENQLGSLVDFNRSGVPLLEIVSEPDISSVEDARLYALKVRQILRYLEVNSGDMEKGVIRFEANVSLRPSGSEQLGTRTEIKNLNSFRSLTDAINFELIRQRGILQAGGQVVQDTMGWSEARQVTYSQRDKEEAHDYRYFPEPDLPPLAIEDSWIDAVRASIPELPQAKMKRYRQDFGLTKYEAEVITEDKPIAQWYEAAVALGGEPKAVSNWMINSLFSLMNEHKQTITEILVTPSDLVDLLELLKKAIINNNTAKDVLAEMFETGKDPKSIVDERGVAQISDEDEIAKIIRETLSQNPQQLQSYLGGKEQLRGWFMGQVMRATKGKANPKIVDQLLSAELDEIKKGQAQTD